MRIANVTVKSVTPYSQSRFIQSERPRDESYDDFEKRTWRERLHVDQNGIVFIPPMSFKNSLSEAAQYKPIKIPGKGSTTYTKHIVAGVLVCEPLSLGIKASEVAGETLYVPSDGRRGGTTRVLKTFPMIPAWGGVVPYMVMDDIITEDIFKTYVEDSGRFIGIGRFRPRNNGYYGRFEVVKIDWE